MESFKERITLLRCSDANPRHAFGLLERVCTILKKHEAFSTNHTGTCIHQGRQEMLLFYCLFKPISGRTKKCIGARKNPIKDDIVALNSLLLQLKHYQHRFLVAKQNTRGQLSKARDRACRNVCSTEQSCHCYLGCSDVEEFLRTS